MRRPEGSVLKSWAPIGAAARALAAPALRAVAMAHLPDGDGGGSGYVSGRQWFIYLFDRQQVRGGGHAACWA